MMNNLAQKLTCGDWSQITHQKAEKQYNHIILHKTCRQLIGKYFKVLKGAGQNVPSPKPKYH